MTIPTITALPEIPAYSDANFETKAPAVLSALRNTFVAEMNAAIAAINNYDYGAAVNASIITGQVAVANGGTGLSTLATGRIPYGAGTDPLASASTLVYSSGKLGVGIASPTEVIHAVGNIRATVGALLDRGAEIGWNSYFSSGYKARADGTGFWIYGNNTNGIDFYTAPSALADAAHTRTLRMRLTTDGKLGIGAAASSPGKDLDVTGEIRASTGILFGTDTAAANTLDDYEEGTWTATVTPNTSGTITLNTSFDLLSYTKIGDTVMCRGMIEVDSVNSPVGTYVSVPTPPGLVPTQTPELSGRFSISCAIIISGVVSVVPCGSFGTTDTISVVVDASTIVAGVQIYFNWQYKV